MSIDEMDGMDGMACSFGIPSPMSHTRLRNTRIITKSSSSSSSSPHSHAISPPCLVVVVIHRHSSSKYTRSSSHRYRLSTVLPASKVDPGRTTTNAYSKTGLPSIDRYRRDLDRTTRPWYHHHPTLPDPAPTSHQERPYLIHHVHPLPHRGDRHLANVHSDDIQRPLLRPNDHVQYGRRWRMVRSRRRWGVDLGLLSDGHHQSRRSRRLAHHLRCESPLPPSQE